MKIAIYDIDYTLVPLACFTQFIIYVFKRYPVTIKYLPVILFWMICRKLRLISLTRYKAVWLLIFKSFSDNELAKLAQCFTENIVIPAIKPGVIEQIADYKEQGYQIVLASSSFEFCIKGLGHYLEADYVFGSRALFKQDAIPSVEGLYCQGEEKVKRIRQVIQSNDTQQSVSYSDDLIDLPLLRLSGKFHLVDKKQWRIIETRFSDKSVS